VDCDARRNFGNQLARQRDLGVARKFLGARCIHEQQRVVVLPKGGRADVAHQQRHALFDALGGGVLQQVVALGGKAYAIQGTTGRTRRLRQRCKNVGVFNKAEFGRLA